MIFFVISPNVLNDKGHPPEKFIEIMEKENIVLMGWGDESDKGKAFRNNINLGDIVIISQGANRNKRDFAVGVVDSDAFSYEYKYKDKNKHSSRELSARKLKYFTNTVKKSIPWTDKCTFGDSNQIVAIYSLKEDNIADKKVMEKVIEIIEKAKPEAKMNEYIELLKTNKNIIFTGAPGTGKTYLAKDIASTMILKKEFTKLSDDEKNEFNKYCSFTQFHPSYDYTDFVEGLRPIKSEDDKNIGFERKDGIFKEFCIKAKDNPNAKYIFIIDEINRGEISKIFGELFYSIDPGYRGEKGKVKTQYSNLIEDEDDKDFYVPENVYIIGTMNDIDRSVESMDFAIRRRFAWVEVKAEDRVSMWDGKIDEYKDEAKERMNSLNNAIKNEDSLSSAYHIGPSYFLKLEDGKDGYSGDFTKLWDYHIKGVLFEYLRGMPDSKEIMDKFQAAYNLTTEETNANNNEEAASE